jgi:hypothetical protein
MLNVGDTTAIDSLRREFSRDTPWPTKKELNWQANKNRVAGHEEYSARTYIHGFCRMPAGYGCIYGTKYQRDFAVVPQTEGLCDGQFLRGLWLGFTLWESSKLVSAQSET